MLFPELNDSEIPDISCQLKVDISGIACQTGSDGVS